MFKRYLGALAPIIQGNNGTPANVVISTTSADAINDDGGGYWKVRDLKLQTTTGGNCMFARNGAIDFQNVVFGACAVWQMVAQAAGLIRATGNYAVSGGAVGHAIAQTGSIQLSLKTITYSNSPAFSFANLNSTVNGVLQADGMTFTNGGTVTGPRWFVSTGGCILTNSGTPNSYIPGNANGSNSDGTGITN